MTALTQLLTASAPQRPSIPSESDTAFNRETAQGRESAKFGASFDDAIRQHNQPDEETEVVGSKENPALQIASPAQTAAATQTFESHDPDPEISTIDIEGSLDVAATTNTESPKTQDGLAKDGPAQTVAEPIVIIAEKGSAPAAPDGETFDAARVAVQPTSALSSEQSPKYQTAGSIEGPTTRLSSQPIDVSLPQTTPLPTDLPDVAKPVTVLTDTETVKLDGKPAPASQPLQTVKLAPDTPIVTADPKTASASQITAEATETPVDPIDLNRPQTAKPGPLVATEAEKVDRSVDGSTRIENRTVLGSTDMTPVKMDGASVETTKIDPIKMSDLAAKTSLTSLATDGPTLSKASPFSMTPTLSSTPIAGWSERMAMTVLQTQTAPQAAPVTLDKIPQAVLAVSLNAKGATLQIDPPELGRIQLDYQFDSQGRTIVTLTPESEAARLALSDRMALITATLEQGTQSRVDVQLGEARDFGESFNQAMTDQNNGSEQDRDGETLSNAAQTGVSSLDNTPLIHLSPDGTERLHILV